MTVTGVFCRYSPSGILRRLCLATTLPYGLPLPASPLTCPRGKPAHWACGLRADVATGDGCLIFAHQAERARHDEHDGQTKSRRGPPDAGGLPETVRARSYPPAWRSLLPRLVDAEVRKPRARKDGF